MHRTVGDIHDAHQLIMVDEWKADERSGREILIVQERMRLGLGDVADQQRLATRRDASRNALPDRDAYALSDAWADAARRGKIQRSAVGRHQHQRASMRVHVVADESEQSVGELPRILRRRIEREYAVDQVDRSRLLTQRFVSTMQLDVRFLELLDGGTDGGLDGVGSPNRATRIFSRLRELSLERDDARRIIGCRAAHIMARAVETRLE